MNEPNVENREQGPVCPETNNMLRLSANERWQLTTDEPDIRGWKVFDRDGNHIGEVSDLLVNASTFDTELIVVQHGRFLGSDMTPIPLNLISLDADDERVEFHGSADDFKAAPIYNDYGLDYRPYFEYWCDRGQTEGFTPPRLRVLERDIY